MHGVAASYQGQIWRHDTTAKLRDTLGENIGRYSHYILSTRPLKCVSQTVQCAVSQNCMACVRDRCVMSGYPVIMMRDTGTGGLCVLRCIF